MAHMLRHTPTGELYIYTDALMKRGDMELVPEEPVVEVVGAAVVPAEIKPSVAPKARIKKASFTDE
jgi:hypothetical protein